LGFACLAVALRYLFLKIMSDTVAIGLAARLWKVPQFKKKLMAMGHGSSITTQKLNAESPQKGEKNECQNEIRVPACVGLILCRNSFVRNKYCTEGFTFKFWNVYSSAFLKKDQVNFPLDNVPFHSTLLVK
jgi:hypothetical protein